MIRRIFLLPVLFSLLAATAPHPAAAAEGVRPEAVAVSEAEFATVPVEIDG